MQGTIQDAARQNSQGIILGDDGATYTYTMLGWRGAATPAAPGMKVDFDVRGSHAVAIYPISGVAPPMGGVHPAQTSPVAGGAPPAPPSPQMQGVPPSQPQPATVATAAGAAMTPQSPQTRKLLGLKWWAIAGGGTLIVVGAVVAVFMLGIVSLTSHPNDVVEDSVVVKEMPATVVIEKQVTIGATAVPSKSQLDDGGAQTDSKPADYQRVYQAAYAETYRDYYDTLYNEQLERLNTSNLTDKQRSNFERQATRQAEKYAEAYAEKYAIGRSIPFAEKYAELITSGKSPAWAAAYAEVYVATGSKKDANAFANRIENGELKDYSKQRDSGKSHKYAYAYAQQIEEGNSEEQAAAHAQQIEDGN